MVKLREYFLVYNVDKDECKENNPCKNNATCINLIGRFECQCPAGYRGDVCDQGNYLVRFDIMTKRLETTPDMIPFRLLSVVVVVVF